MELVGREADAMKELGGLFIFPQQIPQLLLLMMLYGISVHTENYGENVPQRQV